MSDLRESRTFYGIYTDDWSTKWGGVTWNRLLVEDYISDACSVTTNTAWVSGGAKFLYPHNIKKTFYLEGVMDGHITFYADSVKSWVSDFRVSIIKVHTNTTETELATTGVISINDTLTVGTDIVYHYWIDVFLIPKQITENERLGIKIEWDVNNASSATAWLLHDNDSSLEDLKMTMEFVL